MAFVWSPNPGEDEAKYMQRAFKENPTISVRDILKARNAPVLNPVIKPTDLLAKRKGYGPTEREAFLEVENARLRLEVLSLSQRLASMTNMVKTYHNQLSEP